MDAEPHGRAGWGTGYLQSQRSSQDYLLLEKGKATFTAESL